MRPLLAVTTTFVGRRLFSTTLRLPTEWIDTSQPRNVVSVTVSQVFVTVARSEALTSARFVGAASCAGAASAASRHTNAAMQVKPQNNFMAASPHRATRRGKFQAVRLVE